MSKQIEFKPDTSLYIDTKEEKINDRKYDIEDCLIIDSIKCLISEVEVLEEYMRSNTYVKVPDSIKCRIKSDYTKALNLLNVSKETHPNLFEVAEYLNKKLASKSHCKQEEE